MNRREGLMNSLKRIRRGHRIILSCLLASCLLLLPSIPSRGQAQTAAPGAVSPAALMPAGPMVYVEVRDLKSILGWWDGSAEKTNWLASANLEQFRNSKIYLKMASRIEQFSRSAGFELDYSRLALYAGKRSALAIYNPSETEFLFVTELPAIERQATDLIKLRGRFQARQSNGITYYLNQEGGRTVCYAETEPFFVLGTSEELIHAALSLYQKRTGSSALADDASWKQFHSGALLHEARVFLDMSLLTRNANFRNEWIFDNQAALAGYRAAGIDLQWSPKQVIENRTFLRKEEATLPAVLDAALLERYVPNGYEFVTATTEIGDIQELVHRIDRALTNPLPDDARNISRPRRLYDSYHAYQLSRPRSQYEKQTDERDEVIEDVSSIEKAVDSSQLAKWLSTANLKGFVELGRSQKKDSEFLIDFQRAFVLPADAAHLSRQQLRDWIAAEFQELYTAGSLGISWRTRVLAGIEYDILASPALRLACGVVGSAAVVVVPPEYMDRIIQTYQANLAPRFSFTAAAGNRTTYAGLDLRNGGNSFTHLMNVLDYKELQHRGQGAPPLFFSQNIASLLKCLSRIERMTLERKQTPGVMNETVVYTLTTP
jgi:hypothetical protein